MSLEPTDPTLDQRQGNSTDSEYSSPILRVAVAGPFFEALDYLPPPGIHRAALRSGLRLLVPLGRRRQVGVLIGFAEASAHPPERLKAIECLLDPAPLFGELDLALLSWAAAYYQQTLGEVLFAALPGPLRKPGPLPEPTRPGVRLTEAGWMLDPKALHRAPRQHALLEILRHAPQGLALSDLKSQIGELGSILRALRAKGLIAEVELPAAPEGPQVFHPAPGPCLTPEQAAAVQEVQASWGRFQAFLLEGVTGSGKTEVYIRLAEAAIARGQQVLLIVPEIALTPQLYSRLQTRLPGPIAVLHSALPERERFNNWLNAARGSARLILGTRSAVLAPIPRLGLILVDEEHDDSFKQQEGLRYSGRDLAVRRAQLLGCPVVLGSATPSLETLRNAELRRYAWLRLTERAGGARPPELALLDIRNQPLAAGLAPRLRAEIATEINAGNQVLLFLNRRGYAPVLTCHSCGWVGECPHCDARLTLHLADHRLWCHHCGWSCPFPERCPACGGLDLRMLGRGTERLEDELSRLFPEAQIARLDRDSTRRRGALERVLDAARRGEVQILLGTQMLAKGHHLPRVTLVGILELDQAFYAPDFRAAERAAQLIVQVAGRAGRAERPGRVVLQTRHPEHPLLQSLLREGYLGFARAALAERAEAALPPFSHLALLRAEGPELEQAMGFLQQARALGERLGAEPASVLLLGPVPAPMERRAGRHRAQLLLQCARRPLLQRFLRDWMPQVRALPCRQGLRWSIDVDPRDLM
ncbi:primosomal protein N' [Caldichromatium japonicum]|uniref:Replication restart protein PriA n=1 Tax=Caldichromatium japonicum TaxID=2699430 RepID=A0A6G7VEF4_9GAMM|nr:primosomal protein N' [Caldichromatium japonicum]QIK38332.1 primosomal protein N' [Caldichromatium japonicum]